jgi:hypothetical protein
MDPTTIFDIVGKGSHAGLAAGMTTAFGTLRSAPNLSPAEIAGDIRLAVEITEPRGM